MLCAGGVQVVANCADLPKGQTAIHTTHSTGWVLCAAGITGYQVSRGVEASAATTTNEITLVVVDKAASST
jgi:hypothetical protein